MNGNIKTIFYLSPFSFESLNKLFPDTLFDIELLVAFCTKCLSSSYISEYGTTEDFKWLGRTSTLPEIQKALETNDLVIYEYVLRSTEINIRTVICNDALIETSAFNSEAFNDLQPNVLYDVEGEMYTPVYTPQDIQDLIHYVVSKQTPERPFRDSFYYA